MTLLPYRRNDPFPQGSVFYRGEDSAQFTGARRAGGTGIYWPGLIENKTMNPSPLFAKIPKGTIMAEARLRAGFLMGPCPTADPGNHHFDVAISFPPTPPQPPFGLPPGLPPIFFGPTTGKTIVDSIDVVHRVTRTATFLAPSGNVPINRRAVRSQDLVSWLDTKPYDSVLQREADILFITELVRNSDTVVLWRGDTLSARTMADDTMEEVVTVPVGSHAASGTEVYIRLRPVLTHTVEVEASTEFVFMEQESSGFARRVKWMEERTEDQGSRVLQLQVVPNPTAADKAQVQVQVRDAGKVLLGLYTILGQRIAALPDCEADTGGIVNQELDLRGLQPGIYLLVAEQGRHKASVKVTVVAK